MKFTCLRENLLSTLNAASKVVPVKNTLPILSHVLIKAENNGVKILATNLESALSVSLPASVEVDGGSAVSLKLLKEAVSHLTSQSVVLELVGDNLKLTSLTSSSSFTTMPAGDFPAIPSYDNPTSFIELNPSDIFNCVSQVVFSASTDESKPVYTGILLTFSDGVLTAATTDGFRLSEKTLKLTSTASDFTVIVPAKTLLEVVRILSVSSEPIRMFLNDSKNLLFLENSDAYVATGVIDGLFPDYKRIIPTETAHSAEVILKDLLDAVKLSSVFTKEDSDALKFVFDPTGLIQVKSSSQEIGENLSKVNAKVVSTVDAEDIANYLEVAFNPRYLLDILNNLKCEKAVIETASSTAPCMIRPLDEPTYLHIVMPVRLNG